MDFILLQFEVKFEKSSDTTGFSTEREICLFASNLFNKLPLKTQKNNDFYVLKLNKLIISHIVILKKSKNLKSQLQKNLKNLVSIFHMVVYLLVKPYFWVSSQKLDYDHLHHKILSQKQYYLWNYYSIYDLIMM